MALFKKKDDDWNIWDDEEELEQQFVEPKLKKSSTNKFQRNPKQNTLNQSQQYQEYNFQNPNNNQSQLKQNNQSNTNNYTYNNYQQPDNTIQKPKKLSKKERKRQETIQKRIEEGMNQMDNADNVVNPDGNVISLIKVFGFLVGLFVFSLGVIGYMNTDFDDIGKGYVVSYDLHYERDYVKVSDEVLDYCIDFHENLPRMMKAMPTNTISTTDELETYSSNLYKKTEKLKQYSRKPQMMDTYNTQLINFAEHTASLINNIESNYAKAYYLSWAEQEYNSYSQTLTALKAMRGEINNIIYRNVYN